MRPLAALMATLMVLAACSSEPSPTPTVACPTGPPTAVEAQAILADATFATITVSGAVAGEIGMELLGEAAPIATANFVALARCGFYDGIWFHRVLSGFVIQAGDPGTRTQMGDFEGLGTGGPGYQFEIEPPAADLAYDPYSVAMANDTRANGSQFFVALADLDAGLARSYTIFGQVVTGLDVVDAIAAVPVNDPRIGVPLSLVRIDGIAIGTEGAPEASDGG